MFISKKEREKMAEEIDNLKAKYKKQETEIKQLSCDHANVKFYLHVGYFTGCMYYKECKDCGKTLKKYVDVEEYNKAKYIHEKALAEKKLKEAEANYRKVVGTKSKSKK